MNFYKIYFNGEKSYTQVHQLIHKLKNIYKQLISKKVKL